MATKSEESWYQKAAELIVREGKPLAQAALELGIPISARDAENVYRTKAFQTVLWSVRHKFYRELATDPNRSKHTAIGNLQLVIQKLMDEGEWQKAADVIFKMAKVEGWVGSETNVNIFQGLKSPDLDKLEARIKGIGNIRSNSKRTDETDA